MSKTYDARYTPRLYNDDGTHHDFSPVFHTEDSAYYGISMGIDLARELSMDVLFAVRKPNWSKWLELFTFHPDGTMTSFSGLRARFIPAEREKFWEPIDDPDNTAMPFAISIIEEGGSDDNSL